MATVAKQRAMGATMRSGGFRDGGREESMTDILASLDAASSQLKPQPPQRGRLPHVDDILAAQNDWRPPFDRNNPRAEAERLGIAYKAPGRPWNAYSGTMTQEFSSPGYLRGKALEILEQERMVQPRRTYEKFSNTPLRDRARYRFHAHSKPLPEPDKSLLNEQHATWRVQHDKQRDRHLHPVFHRTLREQKMRATASDSILPPMRGALPGETVAAALVMQDVKKESRQSDGNFEHLRPWKTQHKFGQDLYKSHPWKFAESGAESRELGRTLQTFRRTASAQKLAASARQTISGAQLSGTLGGSFGAKQRSGSRQADRDLNVSVAIRWN